MTTPHHHHYHRGRHPRTDRLPPSPPLLCVACIRTPRVCVQPMFRILSVFTFSSFPLAFLSIFPHFSFRLFSFSSLLFPQRGETFGVRIKQREIFAGEKEIVFLKVGMKIRLKVELFRLFALSLQTYTRQSLLVSK